jgi:large subunit ribosomal protein L9
MTESVSFVERGNKNMSSHTTILLREDIDSVGGRGEVVKVRAGYARNYLLPQGLAIVATKGNVRHF